MSKEIKSAISDSLKKIKAEQDMEVSLMADLLNIPFSTFETYLYARNIPALDMVVRICNQFDYPINDFFASLGGKPRDQKLIARIYSNFDMLPEIKRKQIYQMIEPLVQSMVEAMPDLKNAGFGQRIRILREDIRMTLAEAARSSNLQPDSLKVLESNQRLPSIATFLKLCETFHVSPEYLLCNSLTYTFAVDKMLYALTPRELAALAESSYRLCRSVLDK